MNNNKISKFTGTIKVRDIISVFLKRKWIFLGFFMAVLIIGLLFTFIKTPAYQSTSTLKLKDVYYEENLYKYFPEESRILGIFAPGMVVEELESEILASITKDIQGEALLEEVSSKLDFEINKDKLDEAIDSLTDRGNKTVRVIVTYISAEDSFKINSALINAYLENSINEKSRVIENIIVETDNRVAELEEQPGNTDQDESSNDIDTGTDSIDNLIMELSEIKYNLENNKEAYISNIEISEEPGIPGEAMNADNFRNIILSIFAAIAVGLIAVYIPNIFIPLKK